MQGRDVNSLNASGQALFAKGRFSDALTMFRQVRELAPDHPAPLMNEAVCLREMGRDAEAATVAQMALDRAPASGPILEFLGGVLKQTGRFDEAVETFAAAMRAMPQRLSLALDYVSCRKMRESDRPHLDRMLALLEGTESSPEESASLHFATAKFYDDVGEFEAAIEHFDIAHGIAHAMLERSGQAYREEQMETRAQAIARIFTKATLTDPSPGASDSARPLFIVGMVRSGTTLVEQMLTRHPDIAPGGELSFWPRNWQKVSGDRSPKSDGEIRALAQSYLSELEEFNADARVVTDKMPGNYIALGAIHSVFPNAKVIYCLRSPIDNGVSIYTTPFRTSHNWVHRREEIVSYYRWHEVLMEHWRRALPPGVLYEVRYEDLVQRPEETTRAMLQFIGLAWDGACLTPEANERPVRTPSQWQVRQPLYRSSIGRWKNYERWLGALSTLVPQNQRERD